MSVFSDPLAAIFDDDEHSQDECRELIIGQSMAGRLLLVSFTERGKLMVRIISARKATRNERKNMKKLDKAKTPTASSDELCDEYSFDYSKAKPNRFAAKAAGTQQVVTLDADVSAVFSTSEAVNKALRALIDAMPSRVPSNTTTNRGRRSRRT